MNKRTHTLALMRVAQTLLVLLALAGCASTHPKAEDPAAATTNTEKTLAAAEEAVRIGNLEAALPLYTKALHEKPSASIWLKTGIVYFRLGHDREAGYAFDKAIELDPDNADAHEQIGLLYAAHEQIEQARAHLERALDIDPKRWRAHNGLGVLSDLQHDYPTAVAHYHAALAIQPDSAMLLTNLGYSMYLSGDLASAKIELVQAVTRDPQYAPARRNLGLLYARTGAYPDAVQLLSTVMTEAAAYNDVGYIALLREDYSGAETLLTEAVNRSPTYYQIAAENLARARQLLRESGAPAAGESAPDWVGSAARASHDAPPEVASPPAPATAQILPQPG